MKKNDANVARPARIGRIHGSGCARSLIQKKLSWIAKTIFSEFMYSTGFLSRVNSPIMTNICTIIGRQPAAGLTPSFW